jgi:hypothetical protein
MQGAFRVAVALHHGDDLQERWDILLPTTPWRGAALTAVNLRPTLRMSRDPGGAAAT